MMQNPDYRSLGQSDLHVCALGLGCMGMSFAYGPADESESLAVMRRYFEWAGIFSIRLRSMALLPTRNCSASFYGKFRGKPRLLRRNLDSNSKMEPEVRTVHRRMFGAP